MLAVAVGLLRKQAVSPDSSHFLVQGADFSRG